MMSSLNEVVVGRRPVSLLLDGAQMSEVRLVFGFVNAQHSVGAGRDHEKDVERRRRVEAVFEVRDVVLAFPQGIVGVAIEVGVVERAGGTRVKRRDPGRAPNCR